MKKRKSLRSISFLLSLITIFSLFSVLSSASAFAAEESTTLLTEEVEQYTRNLITNSTGRIQSTFAGKTVSFSKYIYNLDDSVDYIYVAFKEGGYVVFVRGTMEMMEYSLQGALPYSNSATQEYYAGPVNYLQKRDSKFANIQTGEVIAISREEAVTFSERTRSSFQSKTEYRSELTLEKGNLESEVNAFLRFNTSAKDTSVGRSTSDADGDTILNNGSTLIPNYQYFIANPMHREEEPRPCGPVATQIFLGYHNYYSDRRIIEDRYLYGFDDATGTVVNGEMNPNYCEDPMTMTRYTLGTRSEATGTNSFFAKVVEVIAPDAEGGSNMRMVSSGIASILNENLSPTDYSVNFDASSNDELNSIIKGEIDAGRPVIIPIWNPDDERPHAVVGYGYGEVPCSDGTDMYEGYVVHYGREFLNCVWIRSSWCWGYITLELYHEHDYVCVGNIGQTGGQEYKCIECDHRTTAAVVMTDETSYTERVASIPPNLYDHNYKDYYVTFETAGSMLFQTFGSANTKLYLFDKEYTQLAYDDNDGWSNNALFSYAVSANTPYILRVQFSDENASGNIKFAITSPSYDVSTYEDIDTMPASGAAWSFDLYYDTTYVLTFTPSTSGTYRIKTTPFDDIDVVVYVADATSTTACHCDDNGSTSQVSNFTMNLVAGKTYFVVVSASDITAEEGFVDFSIRKVS